jgi:peroxiredoxin
LKGSKSYFCAIEPDRSDRHDPHDAVGVSTSSQTRLVGLLIAGLALLLAIHFCDRHFFQRGTPAASAPAFRLALLDGSYVTLGEARGQVLILSFWATWCDPCQRELPGFERVYRRLRSRGIRFIAVNTDGPHAREAVAATSKRLGLTMPVALDDGEVADRYGVSAIPQTVIVDGGGRVRGVYVGVYDERELESTIRVIAK